MKTHRQKGSVLLITLTAVLAMAIVAGSVLSVSINTYKLSMRNKWRADARVVAESEMESLFYEFRRVITAGGEPSLAPTMMANVDIATTANPNPTTLRTPFLAAHRADKWQVRRSVQLFKSDFGTIPGTTKVGEFTYVIARVEVIQPIDGPFANGANTVRIGRRFINSNTSIFQYSVFFQGDMELNPGNDTTINGDIVGNKSIYMGPIVGKVLTLNGQVRYPKDKYFNTNAGGADIFSNPNAPAPPVALIAPTFGSDTDQVVAKASQVEEMDAPENLIGGIDAAGAAANHPELFAPPDAASINPSDWTAEQKRKAENNVYRSVIVPPPAESTTNEYPNLASTSLADTADDPVLSAQRAYNKAGLIITVPETGTATVTYINENGVKTDVTSSFPTAILGTTDLYDEREGKTVKTTTIDVAALKANIETFEAANPAANKFNGLLYVNLKSSSSAAPAAARLKNGSSLPNADDGGFSVVTNGGIYVQGSYNTVSTLTNEDGEARNVPAMLIGDAITVLSTDFVDSATTRPVSDRAAHLSVAEDPDGPTGDVHKGTVTINAGLLTGNTASSGTSSYSSGGVQNLIRYMEDWSNENINYLGSVGQLFESAHMTSPFRTMRNPSDPNSKIYMPPSGRTFTFDENMQKYKPPGNPMTTEFDRGTIFTW